MNTAILGPRGDTVLACLSKRIRELNQNAPLPLLSLEFDAAVSLDPSAVTWDSYDLGAFDCLWVSGFSYLDPVVPDEAGGTDWSVWDARYMARQQSYSALYSVLSELDRRGVSLINPPRAHLDAWVKAQQLARLAESGFCVPPLLCSNDMDAVQAFCCDLGEICWRPVTGRGSWQKFGDKQREHLVALDRPPILLGQGWTGPLKRIWIMDGEPLLALDCRPPAYESIEERARRDFGAPENLEALYGDRRYLETLESFRPFDAAAYGDIWRRLAGHLAIRWFLVTCAESQGALRVYDVDPDPKLDWLPAIYKAWLLECIAERLSGGEEAAGRSKAGHNAPVVPAERPALFLRRMLQILFEMEESKYIEEQPDAQDLEP